MLSENAKKEIEAALRKYPNKRSAVMDALRAAQKGCGGHLTKEDMDEVAAILEMQAVEVNAAAAFYTMYNIDKPVGRYHVQVCRNISCSLLGAEHLIKHMERTLNIKTGETTPDKKFTLSTVECLGSCGTAPMMQINDDYHENLTEAKVDEILKGLE
ncbi:MAG: NADH-quinone oxidoreductase subunit NuoE [Deltaproteobacteria bacterium]|nr:NADH-quinone oxidoreductase subunit NuoE [Deltaproteobacteria bacterium]